MLLKVGVQHRDARDSGHIHRAVLVADRDIALGIRDAHPAERVADGGRRRRYCVASMLPLLLRTVRPRPALVTRTAAEAVGDIHRPGDVARHDRAVAVHHGDVAIVAADLHVAEAVLDAMPPAPARENHGAVAVVDVGRSGEPGDIHPAEAVAQVERRGFRQREVVLDAVGHVAAALVAAGIDGAHGDAGGAFVHGDLDAVGTFLRASLAFSAEQRMVARMAASLPACV